MAKWVKVQVPDDFDQEQVQLGDQSVPVWKPEYRSVLDHGFIGLVDFMGSDDAIITAARTSYGGGTRKVSSDRTLLRYLFRQAHTSPFEMCEFVWHVKLPIFIARQWIRHRTASVNEVSGRYSKLDEQLYIPQYQHTAPQARDNKQGRSDGLLEPNDYEAVRVVLEHIFEEAFVSYRHLLGPETVQAKDADGNLSTHTVQAPPPDAIQQRKLWLQEAAIKGLERARELARERGDDRFNINSVTIEEKLQEYMLANDLHLIGPEFPGLAREIARIVLPLATYTQWYWKCDLHNLFHFLALRSDPHAQYEIRVYADAMLEMIQPYVPWAVEAFQDYQQKASRMSRMELDLLRKIINKVAFPEGDPNQAYAGQIPTLEDFVRSEVDPSEMSQREIKEFLAKLS